MTSTPDTRLTGALDLARAALGEITPPATVGDPAGYDVSDDGVVSLRFANRMSGYPGWFWTVSVAAADADAEPTVLELELLPGDGALVAPDWVPWAVRLADYHAAQAALAEAGMAVHEDDVLDEIDGDDLDEDGSDDDDLDEDADDSDEDEDADEDAEDDAEVTPVLHAGDLDGVDIDELDPDDAETDDAEDGEDEADSDAEDDDPDGAGDAEDADPDDAGDDIIGEPDDGHPSDGDPSRA